MNAPIEAALLTPPTDHAGVALPTIVRLSQLAPSPTNPRRTFRDESLQEMAVSIARHGVLQAILARPWPATIPKPHPDVQLEIVAGERRYRASMLAGVETIPATVRSLSDTETLEIQILENLQREEVHPLEEAEGYQVLMLRTNHTADQLAEKVGKSKAYIYARLKLCAITGDAREAFMAGTLSASVALLIARIPVPAIQSKAAKEVLNGHYGNGEPMSARMATQHIQQRYMLRLADAPFSKAKDAYEGLEGVPGCKQCPKRTGNAPELFSDVKSADVCTDPDCFAAKKNAHKLRQITVAENRGQRVIIGKDAEKIAPYGVHEYNDLHGGWVQLCKTVYDAPKTAKGKLPTWRDLVGPEFQAGAMVENHQDGILYECAQEKDLIEAAKANGVEIAARPGRGGGSDSEREKEKIAKEQTALRRTLVEQIMSRSEGVELDIDELTALATVAYERLDFEARKLTCKVWGVDGKIEHQQVSEMNTEIEQMETADLNRFLRLLTFVGHIRVGSYSSNPTEIPAAIAGACRKWNVDIKTLRGQGGDAGKKREAQYRHPHSGNTWTGRGMKPAWVAEWLNAGNTLDELRVAHA